MKITKQLMQELRGEIEAALEAVGQKHGLTFKTGAGTYGEQTAHYKLELAVVGENGKPVLPDQDYLNRFPPSWLTPEMRSKPFTLWRNTYVLDGYNPRKAKPWIVTQPGKEGRWLLSEVHVKQGLGVKIEDWELPELTATPHR